MFDSSYRHWGHWGHWGHLHSFRTVALKKILWHIRSVNKTTVSAAYYNTWSGPIGLAWPQLWPQSWPKKVLAWLQKLAWPKILPLKNAWPQTSKSFFSLPTLDLGLSLVIQLVIDLNKYSTKHYLSTHESICIGAVNILSWNWSVFISFFIHLFIFCKV